MAESTIPKATPAFRTRSTASGFRISPSRTSAARIRAFWRRAVSRLSSSDAAANARPTRAIAHSARDKEGPREWRACCQDDRSSMRRAGGRMHIASEPAASLLTVMASHVLLRAGVARFCQKALRPRQRIAPAVERPARPFPEWRTAPTSCLGCERFRFHGEAGSGERFGSLVARQQSLGTVRNRVWHRLIITFAGKPAGL